MQHLEDQLRLPVLAEREATHGNFATTALIAQRFKDVSGERLQLERQPDRRAARKPRSGDGDLHLAFARILSGDPNHPDAWDDIPKAMRELAIANSCRKPRWQRASVLVAVQPAHACHRFKRWSYPFPQRCGYLSGRLNTQIMAQAPRPAVQPSKDDVTEKVILEITVTSELLETWARQDAIEKLKGEIK